MDVFIVSIQMNKNETEMCQFEMYMEHFFVSALSW